MPLKRLTKVAIEKTIMYKSKPIAKFSIQTATSVCIRLYANEVQQTSIASCSTITTYRSIELNEKDGQKRFGYDGSAALNIDKNSECNDHCNRSVNANGSLMCNAVPLASSNWHWQHLQRKNHQRLLTPSKRPTSNAKTLANLLLVFLSFLCLSKSIALVSCTSERAAIAANSMISVNNVGQSVNWPMQQSNRTIQSQPNDERRHSSEPDNTELLHNEHRIQSLSSSSSMVAPSPTITTSTITSINNKQNETNLNASFNKTYTIDERSQGTKRSNRRNYLRTTAAESSSNEFPAYSSDREADMKENTPHLAKPGTEHGTERPLQRLADNLATILRANIENGTTIHRIDGNTDDDGYAVGENFENSSLAQQQLFDYPVRFSPIVFANPTHTATSNHLISNQYKNNSNFIKVFSKYVNDPIKYNSLINSKTNIQTKHKFELNNINKLANFFPFDPTQLKLNKGDKFTKHLMNRYNNNDDNYDNNNNNNNEINNRVNKRKLDENQANQLLVGLYTNSFNSSFSSNARLFVKTIQNLNSTKLNSKFISINRNKENFNEPNYSENPHLSMQSIIFYDRNGQYQQTKPQNFTQNSIDSKLNNFDDDINNSHNNKSDNSNSINTSINQTQLSPLTVKRFVNNGMDDTKTNNENDINDSIHNQIDAHPSQVIKNYKNSSKLPSNHNQMNKNNTNTAMEKPHQNSTIYYRQKELLLTKIASAACSNCVYKPDSSQNTEPIIQRHNQMTTTAITSISNTKHEAPITHPESEPSVEIITLSNSQVQIEHDSEVSETNENQIERSTVVSDGSGRTNMNTEFSLPVTSSTEAIRRRNGVTSSNVSYFLNNLIKSNTFTNKSQLNPFKFNNNKYFEDFLIHPNNYDNNNITYKQHENDNNITFNDNKNTNKIMNKTRFMVTNTFNFTIYNKNNINEENTSQISTIYNNFKLINDTHLIQTIPSDNYDPLNETNSKASVHTIGQQSKIVVNEFSDDNADGFHPNNFSINDAPKSIIYPNNATKLLNFDQFQFNKKSISENLTKANIEFIVQSDVAQSRQQREQMAKTAINGRTATSAHEMPNVVATAPASKLKMMHATVATIRSKRKKEPAVSITVDKDNGIGTSSKKIKNTVQHELSAKKLDSDLMRLESIKYQILSKLGLKEKPKITRTIPKHIILNTISRADGNNRHRHRHSQQQQQQHRQWQSHHDKHRSFGHKSHKIDRPTYNVNDVLYNDEENHVLTVSRYSQDDKKLLYDNVTISTIRPLNDDDDVGDGIERDDNQATEHSKFYKMHREYDDNNDPLWHNDGKRDLPFHSFHILFTGKIV